MSEESAKSKEIKSGDFLSDVEITIFLRSSGTDYRNLKKLMNAIMASSTSLLDTKVVTLFLEEKVTQQPGKNLICLTSKLYVE
jgi:hypothetical protein